MRTSSAVVGAFIAVWVGLGLPAPIAAASATEDSPEWDCRYDGNRVCGPGNPDGFDAGTYWNGPALPCPDNPGAMCDLYMTPWDGR